MNRDLRADLEYLDKHIQNGRVTNVTLNDFVSLAMVSWPEAIDRALEAEAEAEHLIVHSISLKQELMEGLKREGSLSVYVAEKKQDRVALREENERLKKCYDITNDSWKTLKEENDLQRASIQQLSAQVAELRECLRPFSDFYVALKELRTQHGYNNLVDGEIIHNYCMFEPLLQVQHLREAHELLSSPDPGAEIRERMAKLEAVAEAAKDVKRCIGHLYLAPSPVGRLKQALADLEADRP